MTSETKHDSSKWYSVSRKLTGQILGIDIPRSAQDGIGEFADANRVIDFCNLYREHPDLHPIARAECLDAVLSSLSLAIEQGLATASIFSRVRSIVVDAQRNPWASSELLCREHTNPDIDPGDHAVHDWLTSIDELNFELIRANNAQLNSNSNYDTDQS